MNSKAITYNPAIVDPDIHVDIYRPEKAAGLGFYKAERIKLHDK